MLLLCNADCNMLHFKVGFNFDLILVDSQFPLLGDKEYFYNTAGVVM